MQPWELALPPASTPNGRTCSSFDTLPEGPLAPMAADRLDNLRNCPMRADGAFGAVGQTKSRSWKAQYEPPVATALARVARGRVGTYPRPRGWGRLLMWHREQERCSCALQAVLSQRRILGIRIRCHPIPS